MKTKLLGLIFAGILLAAGPASAAVVSLSVSGGSGSTLPSSFGSFPPISGLVTPGVTPITEFNTANAATGGLQVSNPGIVHFQYVGFDASYQNSFGSGLTTLFTTAGSAVGDTAQIVASGAGLVPFFFHTNGGGTPAGTANNGGPITSPLSVAFADLGDGSFLALFNDGGGSPTDDKDYNDMIVRVSVSPVPLPAAAWLLISAVLGLVSFSRIRRNGTQSV
jgi:hypothetical protein